MAHVFRLPMLVMICRTADGLALQRWRQYHAYVFNMEFILYECYDFEQPGVYLAFLCDSVFFNRSWR